MASNERRKAVPPDIYYPNNVKDQLIKPPIDSITGMLE
jgi:hypothetical protein